jgi:nucleotide-binding universal stress UspA family protein
LKQGKINVILRKGKVYSEVAFVARMIEADIVFAGTHGVSGFEQYWIGSNAYRIVTYSPCPVITLRGDFEISDSIKNILLPIDSTPETKQKLPFAAQLASVFDATIHLAVLYNSPISVIRNRIKSYTDEAVKLLQQQNISFVVEELEAENIVSCLLNYAESSSADMVVSMTEQGGTSGGMFLGPYAQQLINNSFIPVLSLQSQSSD